MDLKLYVGMCYDHVATMRLDAIIAKLILMVSMCVSNLEDIYRLVFIMLTKLIKLVLAFWWLDVLFSCGVWMVRMGSSWSYVFCY